MTKKEKDIIEKSKKRSLTLKKVKSILPFFF